MIEGVILENTRLTPLSVSRPYPPRYTKAESHPVSQKKAEVRPIDHLNNSALHQIHKGNEKSGQLNPTTVQ
jgi:hypothetical protein